MSPVTENQGKEENGESARHVGNGHSHNGSGDEGTASKPASPVHLEPKGPPQACLFVASLSPGTTADSLRQFFSGYGDLLKIKLLKDRSARPYAFIQFKDVESSTKALQETNNQELDGRHLRVERARVNRTLFIAKMDRTLSTAQIKEMVQAEFGAVEEVTIIKHHQTNKSKGCGFVKFIYREDAMNAFLALRNNERGWIVEWATNHTDPEAIGVDKSHIFVGGLNPSLVTKELLEARFGAYGEIANITLINRETDVIEDQSSPRSAFAFIHFSESESSGKAIHKENGAEWLERKIRVQYCESQEMKNKRKAYKYWNNIVQYDNNGYFRGIPNPSPLFVVPPMYGQQTQGYVRKGEMQTSMQPYMTYPYSPMMYGNQGWMYPHGANGEMDQQGYEADPQMLGDVPSPQFYRHSRMPDEAHMQHHVMNGVDERHLVESMARMQVLPQATTW